MNKEKRHIRKGLTNALLTLGMAFSLTIFMPGGILEARADDPVAKVGETPYNTLQAAVDNAQNGDTIVLQRDAVKEGIAINYKNLLFIGNGKTVTIDLNGYAINKDLDSPDYDYGSVIIINDNGHLTITDTSAAKTGKITGGNTYNEGHGGGVSVGLGTFTMEGGTICGNKARNGGGVNIQSGTFTMNGGKICGNVASIPSNGSGYSQGYGTGVFVNNSTFEMNGGEISGNNNLSNTLGGGVYQYQGGKFRISGSPVIKDNVLGTDNNNRKTVNVELTSWKIELSGPLGEGAKIGVKKPSSSAITSGWSEYMGTANPAKYFTSDDPNYEFTVSDGEVKLATHDSNSITYSASGDTVSATCPNAGCTTMSSNPMTLKIVKPEKTVCDDSNSAAATLSGLKVFNTATGLSVSEESIRYAGSGDTVYAESSTAPTAPGTYKASITVQGQTASVTYTIDKSAVPAGDITAPTAKTLTYNGQAQELINAGSVKNGSGTMQYALGTETQATEPYTTSIPSKTEAGTYYVWYKVVGDGNHKDTEAKCVKVTIAEKKEESKEEPVITPSENKAMDVKAENIDGDYQVTYAHQVPFPGKGKLTVESFGENFTVSQGNTTYKVKKIKVNKKKKKIQITGLVDAPKDVEKAVKKATKGDKGIPYTQNPYYVRDTDKVTPKFKKSGAAASVKVNINGKDYKAKKTEYDYNEASKLIIFKGENLAGSWTVK